MAAAGKELGTRVRTLRFDATALDTHPALIAEAFAGGDVDLVISAAGILTAQQTLDRDPLAAGLLVETNFTGHVSTLLAAAGRMRAQGHGTIVVLSSIAAIRPRKANFVYGAAKSGLDAFGRGLAGLAARHGGARAAGGAWLRDRPDDGGDAPGAAVHHACGGLRGRGRAAPPGGRDVSWRRGLGAADAGSGGSRLPARPASFSSGARACPGRGRCPPMRVLVAEDDRGLRKTLSRGLRESGLHGLRHACLTAGRPSSTCAASTTRWWSSTGGCPGSPASRCCSGCAGTAGPTRSSC